MRTDHDGVGFRVLRTEGIESTEPANSPALDFDRGARVPAAHDEIHLIVIPVTPPRHPISFAHGVSEYICANGTLHQMAAAFRIREQHVAVLTI